jgi:FtsZ-binding cell division protein ZapB
MNDYQTSIPILTTLRSTDATAIRGIVSHMTMEIDKLKRRIEQLEKKNSDSDARRNSYRNPSDRSQR